MMNGFAKHDTHESAEYGLASAVAPVESSSGASLVMNCGSPPRHEDKESHSIEHFMETGEFRQGIINHLLLKPVFPEAKQSGEQWLPWRKTKIIYKRNKFWMYEEGSDRFLMSAVRDVDVFYISQFETFPNNFCGEQSASKNANTQKSHYIATMLPGPNKHSFQLFSTCCENCDDRLGTYSCQPGIEAERNNSLGKISDDSNADRLSLRKHFLQSLGIYGKEMDQCPHTTSGFSAEWPVKRELLAEIEQWHEELPGGGEVFRKVRLNVPRITKDYTRIVWCPRNPPGSSSGFSLRLALEKSEAFSRKTRRRRKVTTHYHHTYSPLVTSKDSPQRSFEERANIDEFKLSNNTPMCPGLERSMPSFSNEVGLSDSKSMDEIPSLQQSLTDPNISPSAGIKQTAQRGMLNFLDTKPARHIGPPTSSPGRDGRRGIEMNTKGNHQYTLRSRTDTALDSSTSPLKKEHKRLATLDEPQFGFLPRSMSETDQNRTDSGFEPLGYDKLSITDSGSSAYESIDGLEETYDEVISVDNKIPRWSPKLNSFILRFVGSGSRVRESSSKNFLFSIDAFHPAMKPVSSALPVMLSRPTRSSSLESSKSSGGNRDQQNQSIACLQVGKFEEGVLTCDFRYPFCALQAFAFALSNFRWLPSSSDNQNSDEDSEASFGGLDSDSS